MGTATITYTVPGAQSAARVKLTLWNSLTGMRPASYAAEKVIDPV